MKRRDEFAIGEYYHIYNRGVDKREIFIDPRDYSRFIYNIYEFNNDGPSMRNLKRRFSVQGEALHTSPVQRVPIVEVSCYCLIRNHYHFIMKQLKDNGISNFMHKFGTAYVMYFNEKYERTGRLFEGPFQAKLIKSDEYFTHLSRYIHLNCVCIIQSKWKEEGIKDWDKVIRFLESYKWSSYLDYIGKQNFPSIIDKKFLQGYFKSPEEYKKFVQSWMKKDIDTLEDLLFE